MIVDLEKNKQLSARDDRGIKASPSQVCACRLGEADALNCSW